MRWFVSRQSVSCDCLFRCCRVLLQPDCHCCCPQPIVHYSSVSTKINARKKFYFRYDKLNIDKVHVLNPRIVFNENKIARESNRIAIGRAREGEGVRGKNTIHQFRTKDKIKRNFKYTLTARIIAKRNLFYRFRFVCKSQKWNEKKRQPQHKKCQYLFFLRTLNESKWKSLDSKKK